MSTTYCLESGRWIIWSALLLCLYGCGPSNGVKPQSGTTPSQTISKDDDPDGDGTAGDKDVEPYVADCPGLDIGIVGFKLGLARESELTESAFELEMRESDIRQVYSQSEEEFAESASVRRTSMSYFSGNGMVQMGPYAVPFGYAGSSGQSTHETSATRRSVCSVKKERLKTASDRLSVLSQSGRVSKIGPKAGYLQVTAQLPLYGHVAFTIEDFDLNVLLDGKPWDTFSAKSQGGFQPKIFRGLDPHEDSVLLTFGGIESEKVRALMGSKQDVQSVVPRGSVFDALCGGGASPNPCNRCQEMCFR